MGRHLLARPHKVSDGSLTADQYIREVMEENVEPFLPIIGDNFVLMQDNVCPHVARITMEYLQEAGIQVLDWPAVSPDLNPIEHIWDHLERHIRARTIDPDNPDELENALREEWENLNLEYITALIRSLPRRMTVSLEPEVAIPDTELLQLFLEFVILTSDY